MTGIGPTSQRPQGPDGADGGELPPPPSSPAERANRLSAANMLRSLLPLVVICLLIVGWAAFRQNDVDPVREVDPTSTIQLADARAGYELLVPTGLPEEYRPTSARTDAGNVSEGDPVTLEIGYVTPDGAFAGFVISDAARAAPVDEVLDGATEDGSVDIGGAPWTRSTTERGETALSRTDGDVTVVVSGSAADDELREVAAAVAPYTAA
ncbi:DUF4245 domain-containing protein [Blastococcus sp. TBT05-19]|uniref:DUF4245 domain-containing protein n=1 Tax=Blastococcus sp. TBT05-19 TaxID=2250581 RepID=UPI000DEAD6E9|nr:DUF4245 domain-containing protein [Blastococcus sp. TBT05-19]RBY94331.1 DUF4245 domain-containing protein [Blastococcus sp. TBT05-19]